MPRMKKKEVIAAINAFPGKEDITDGKYNDLCNLLKMLQGGDVEPKPPILLEQSVAKSPQIRFESRIPKRNMFLADAIRDERDAIALRAELTKREHKGKIKTVTTVKHMDITENGDWLTEFIIDLKE